MFFNASKILWFLGQPSSFILIIIVTGAVLLILGRMKTGRRFTVVGAALYLFFGLSPAGHLLMTPLEERFPRPELSPSFSPRGIIILGGAVDVMVSAARPEAALNEAGERMIEAVALARRYPGAKLVFTGGSADLIYEADPETVAAERFFRAFGIPAEQVIYERQSRNTHENAVRTRETLGDLSGGDWLLVTSAFHMPRSMELFRKAGFNVIPWPVDYRTRGWVDATRFFSRPSEGLRRTDLAVKEWAGLLLYWLSGRTRVLFPK